MTTLEKINAKLQDVDTARGAPVRPDATPHAIELLCQEIDELRARMPAARTPRPSLGGAGGAAGEG